MKRRNSFKKRVSRFLVVVVISSLLSSFYSSAAFAKELNDLTEQGNYDGYEAEAEDLTEDGIVDENELSEGSEEASDGKTVEEDSPEEASQEDSQEEVSQEDSQEEDSQEEDSQEEISHEISEDDVSEEASEETIDSEETGNNEENKKIEDIEESSEILLPVYDKSSKNGWVQEDDNWKYYVNGTAVTNNVKEIDGFYYAFNYQGYLLKNGFSEIWDADDNLLLVCSQEDGKLLTDCWYTDNYDDTYYFGSNGVAYTGGAYEVEGKKYLFANWGYLLPNACYTNGKGCFISDSEGIAVELSCEDGWKEAFGRKYYLSNGQFVNGIKEINGVSYGFRGDYQLCVNNTFSTWEYDENTETDYYILYATNSDGQIITNSWFESEWGNRSYHGKDGKAYTNGVFTIGNTKYLFNEWGLLWCNGSYSDGKKNYISDENGVVTEIGQDGWTTINGNKYYILNGTPVKSSVKKIDGFYYAFDDAGCMYDNDFAEIWVDNEDIYLIVFAQEGGKLLTDSWYTDDCEDTYYFGSNGLAYTNGAYEIDGEKYLLGYWGYLLRNSCYINENGCYISDSNGITVELSGDDGWKEAFGRKYYLENGQVVSGVKEINGVLYGFHSDCHLCINDTLGFWIYDENTDTNYYDLYATNADGQIITNSWFETKWGARSYHGKDGKAYTNGVYVIEKTSYLFNEWGYLWCNASYNDGKKSYISDEKGVATALDQDGWITINGNKYYAENGVIVKNCVKEIKGLLYGFDYDGKLYDNTMFSLYSDSGERTEYYAAEGGILYVNWWYEPYGTRFGYFGADGKRYTNGKYTIEGTDYLFDESGYLICNGGMTIDGVNYITDADGKARKIEKDGWTQIDNKWFYIENGVLVSSCVKEIKGALYYFNYHGVMAENEYITTYDDDGNPMTYAAGSGGKLIRNEWYLLPDGSRYSYHGADGLAYANGVYNIGGTDYLFNYYGQLARGKAFKSNNKNYASDENGVAYELKSDGWNKIGNGWFYTESGEFARNEKRKIDGSFYYFDQSGRMMEETFITNYGYKIDPTTGDYIQFRESYFAKKGGKLCVNEWYSGYYYGSDGVAYSDGVYEIDGNLYKFGSYGALRLTIFSYNNKNYLTDDSGIAHEITGDGWMHIGDDDVYIKNGKLVTGVTKINKTYYYFSYRGLLVRNTIVESNKIAYYADESGKFSRMAEGFNEIGNDVYFVENGGLIRRAIKEINGVGYAFDASGKLIKEDGFNFEGRRGNTWNSYDPYDPYDPANSGNSINPYPSGTASGNAYDPYNPDGKYAVGYSTAASKGYLPYTATSNAYNPYYADKNGVALRNQWHKELIDGLVCWSYFGENCRKLAGLNKIGQDLYFMDILGIMQTGWQKVDNNWYFFESNGAAQYGWKKLSEKWYYFNDGGVMQTGWQKINGIWYYFASGGSMQTGWQKINGTWYYFASGGAMQTGWQKINGTWYYFASGGAMQTGWQKINGTWYYFASGGAMQTGWVKSGKKWYYMQSGGAMQTGWVKLGSTWYYLSSDGSMVTGSKKIGNKTYKFASNGACLNP